MTTAQNHPTGLAATGAAVLVIVCRKLGVEVSGDEAAIVVAFVAGVVSVFTPRLKETP